MAKDWNPRLYGETARYVSDHGAPVVEWLAPQPGERVLDLGCGDGALTRDLLEAGCSVTGVDQSRAMVEAALRRGIDARVMDARRLEFDGEFDAVFSNAALHWVREAEDVARGVARALRPGGRFVCEFGGKGNVAQVCACLRRELTRAGVETDATCGWYFPRPDEYRELLERRGFEVRRIELIPRPTPTPGDAAEWLMNFADHLLALAPASHRPRIVKKINDDLEPALRGEDGVWRIDYVRLRCAAVRRG